NSYISKLLVARDGRLWIGTFAGLASWKDGRLSLYPEVAGQYVLSLAEDSEGTVWTGTQAPPGGKLCAIQQSQARCYGQDGSLGRGVASLHEYGGHIWALAQTGLWRWSPGAPSLFNLHSGVPRDLIRGDDEKLLVATATGIVQVSGDHVERFVV